jgi:ferric-dicitrate binding protein FerR (iron transport regulator)
MPRPLCLLMLFLLPLAVENRAQKTQTSRTHRSTAVDPRVEMSLRDGWRFKLGPDSATELKAEHPSVCHTPGTGWATTRTHPRPTSTPRRTW